MTATFARDGLREVHVTEARRGSPPVALVTGAPEGIGAAAAIRLGADGLAVAVSYRPDPERAEQGEAVSAQIREGGGAAIAVPGDVSDPDSVDAMFGEVEKELGPVGVLVANAARSDRRPWTEITIDGWDEMMAVNLRGAFLCARRAFDGMREQGFGRIITLGSITSELGSNGSLHYVTTKAGLIGFTRSLSREVGVHGITVNCLMPGAIRTELEIRNRPDQEQLAEELAKKQAVPRRGVPQDTAHAISFLASPESSFITGQVLNVDGGWVHY